MAGYVRQSTAEIQPTLTILSSSINKEYNQLELAFGTSGHTHDGTAGNGPKIDLSTSTTGILPVSRGGTGDPSLIGNIQNSIDNKLDKSGGYVTGNIYKTIDLSSTQVDLLFGLVLEDNSAEVGKIYAAAINNVPSGSSHNTVIGFSGLSYNPYHLSNKEEHGIPVYGPNLRLHVGNPSQPTDAVNLSTLNSQLNLRVVTPTTSTLPENGRKYVLTNTRSGSSYSPSLSPVSTPSNAPLPNSIAAYGPSGTLRVNDANDNWDAINLGQADDRYLKLSGGNLTGQLVSTVPDNTYSLLYKNGAANSGLFNHEGNAALYLRNADGDLTTYIRPDVTSVFSSSISVAGNVSSSSSPTASNHLTRKDYVDSSIGNAISGLSSVFLPLTGGTLTGELTTTAVNSFRMAYGGRSTFWRQDGNTQYLMISDTPTGTYNDLRPFAVNLTSGRVTLGNGLTVTGGITGTASWANGATYADRLGSGGWTLATVQDQLNWRLTDTRFSGYTAGALDVRSNVDVGLSVGASGYVLTGVSKSANHMSFQFRQPQIHIPNVGWRALGSW